MEATLEVEVTVEHRLVVICWIANETLCVLGGPGGTRRYQKDCYDWRITMGEGPGLPYFFDPAKALEAMRGGVQVQLEWRAYEELVLSGGDHFSGFAYSNEFNAELLNKAAPKALRPYSDQDLAKVRRMRLDGEDPTSLDIPSTRKARA
jgi:hypothetical protein